jgi:hypothetical protein
VLGWIIEDDGHTVEKIDRTTKVIEVFNLMWDTLYMNMNFEQRNCVI